jgi:hypothetical protein
MLFFAIAFRHQERSRKSEEAGIESNSSWSMLLLLIY